MENEIKKKLFELLPDYVFGRLSAEEKDFFEQNYQRFDDIIEEVNQAKAFFKQLEQMDFDKVFSEHTRNTSVGVLSKLEKGYQPKNKLTFTPKFAIPVLAILVLFLAFQLDYLQKRISYIHIDKQTISKIDSIKISDSLLTDELSTSEISSLLSYSTLLIPEIDTEDNDLEELSSTFAELAQDENVLNYLDNNNIYNYFENIDENKFQELIEEIYKNEDIKN